MHRYDYTDDMSEYAKSEDYHHHYYYYSCCCYYHQNHHHDLQHVNEPTSLAKVRDTGSWKSSFPCAIRVSRRVLTVRVSIKGTYCKGFYKRYLGVTVSMKGTTKVSRRGTIGA